MTDLKLGTQLNTRPQQFSPFDEFEIEEGKQNFRLGYIPSLTTQVESRNVKNVIAVFFRVCNSQSNSPFLTFLVYQNCNDEFELPSIKHDYLEECFDTKVNDLVNYVSKRARIRYINKIGYVGSGKTRYVLCEVLNSDVPYDSTMSSSFSWLTTGEIVQDKVMGVHICDNVRQFIQEVTGACRLFKNEIIVPGPKIAYLVCDHSNFKRLPFDSNFKLELNNEYWFSEYELAVLNGFFGIEPIENGCVLRRNKLRDRVHIFRMVLPSDSQVTQCILQLEDMEPISYLKYDCSNDNGFVISRNVVEYSGKTNMIYEFLNSKTKPFFSS